MDADNKSLGAPASSVIVPGDRVSLVFKAQPFAPMPNPETRTVEMVLNIISGTYRGPDPEAGSGGFLFETETGSGRGVLWRVRDAEVLMKGTLQDVARLASH